MSIQENTAKQATKLVQMSTDDCRASLQCNWYSLSVQEAALAMSKELGHKTRMKMLRAEINRIASGRKEAV